MHTVNLLKQMWHTAYRTLTEDHVFSLTIYGILFSTVQVLAHCKPAELSKYGTPSTVHCIQPNHIWYPIQYSTGAGASIVCTL
jgi:hypothetical protein